MKNFTRFILFLFFINTAQYCFSQSCPLSCMPEGAVYELCPLYYPKGQASFNTIASQIPTIAKLGVKTIYLMPVFKESGVSTSASDTVRFRNAYDIEDYYQLDPYCGTDADLQNMIDTAHKYGLRVLFDLVLNHTYYPSVFMDSAWDYRITSTQLKDTAISMGYPVMYDTIGGQVFPYINKQYIPGDSTYSFRGWLDSKGVIHVMHYPTWHWWFGVDYTNKGLIRYVVNLSKYCISHFNFDGWRLDAPSDNVNPYFFSGTHAMDTLLQDVKDTMIALKPSSVLISEVSHSSRPLTSVNDFDQMVEASYDAVYVYNLLATSDAANYPTYKVTNLLTQIPKENILNNRSRLRFSENHDSPRINTYASKLNFSLLVFNSTIYPGIPMIQAGQEVGATNYFYSVPTSGYDTMQTRIWNFYRKVFHTRSLFSALKYGTLQNVQTSTTGDSTMVYSYTRDSGSQHILVMVNFDSVPVTNTLNLPYTAGTMLYDSLSTDSFMVSNPSAFTISVPAYTSRILIPANTVITGIDNTIASSLVSTIYPNPFTSFATIQFSVPVTNAELGIYNVCGQQIRSLHNITGDHFIIPRGNMSAGFYFYRIKQSGKPDIMGKMVVAE